MTMGSRSAEAETSNLPVPLRVEAPDLSTPPPIGRKRMLTKSSTAKPKKFKVFASTTLVTRVVGVCFFTCNYLCCLSFFSLPKF